jgi:hypothetical protein
MNRMPAAPVAAVARLAQAAALTLAVAFGAPALAAVCQDVTFTVKNGHVTNDSIKIKKVKYLDVTANTTNTEDVVDITCSAGNTCSTLGDDLGSAFEARLGHDLTNVQFQFQYKELDGDWSSPVWSKKFKPTDRECRNDRNYGSDSWVITG